MLKVIDYLTKEKISSEASEEVQRAKQIVSRRKALRFKRSDDNPELPENFKVGQAIGGGDCFFDSAAKGLKQLKPEMDFTVKSLREVCKRFAQSQLENDQSWLKGALRNEAEPISVYVPRVEFTADDIEQKSGSVNVLGLTSPIWGRSEIEGRIICKEYNVKLHVVEKHVVEGKEVWLDQIVNSEGSRSVDSIDYNEENTIHIINRGNAHFEPILSTQEIRHNKQQSPDPSDYDDEITPEEELINIIKSRDSEEEKLTKIRKLFEKEPKPNINFQGEDNDTPLHIVVRKKELKVIEWLVKNGAKIDIKNNRGRTSLDIAKRLKRQDIVQILESHIQQVSVEEQPAKQERPSEENKLEDTDQKSKGLEQERRIPYSDKLPFDKDLKLSNGNFKSIVESDIKHVELNAADKLNFLNRPAYPNEYLLVHFASRVYKEREDGQELPDKKLPEGWKLLTTAYNQGATNHYFGAAYWNPDQQQIVIAHRGTDPSSTGALWTDIRGILQNNYVPQINSAVTFSNKIKTVLDELNKKPNVNLQLSFTGHSLGGWLAQITTFTTKYFILEPFDESSFFVKSEKVGYHAHTVAFDSPGSKDMLSKIKSDFDLRHYKDDNSLSLSYLDITSYLSAPNLVNTCCLHLGTIYRVFIEDLPPERSSWDFAKYTKETHSIVKIKEALDPEKGNELKAVIDWPIVKKGITRRALEKLLSSSHGILGVLRRIVFNQGKSEQLPERNEYEYFHKLAGDVSDYNPEPDDKEGYCTVRYQVQDVDKKKCSTRIFTQPELEFLRDYQKLRQFLTSPQLQGLFSSFNNENTVKKAIEALKNFKVEDRKKTVHCQSEKELDELITYVKNALYFFPDIKSKTKNVQTRKPIWFDVEDLVRPFTALTPGRQEKLEQIASSIQEGIVVISGLGGVGKSELAVKYARSQYSQEDSVIWINAETRETAKDSFHRLHKKLGLKIKDEDGEEKSIELVIEEIYKHLNDGKRLFIFDNAEKYSTIEKFLPLGLPDNANKPYVLITSPNNLEWKSARVNIGILSLGDFTDAEAIEFVKTALEIGDDSQNVDITNLVKRLHNFPLALQHAVTYIKDASEEFQARGSEFKVSDYLEKYEQEPKKMLSIKSIDDEHTEAIFKALKITIDKIRDNKEYGQQALDMLNIASYFMSRNIPEKTFLNELASGNQEKLISITRLLRKYSIVNLEQGMLNVHGLVQQIRRLELGDQQEEGKSLEEKILERALGLLKEYVKVSPGNAASCIPHIISIWDYASKYDELIKSFVVDSTNNKATTSTTYFDLIIEGSNYEVIDAIIKKISSDNLKEVINAKNKDDVTPLHKAVLRNDEKIVKLLIDEGADVNAKKSNGWTPLHLAAKNGNLEVVNALLEKDANVDDKTSSKYRFTPLHLAARNGHKEVVEALLARNANVNVKTGYEFTPLHLAAKNNYLEVVQTLLKNDKINVDAKTEYKFTPLHLAAEKGHSKVVRALLDGNASVNALDNGNFTPLHLAAKNGHLEVVNILLDKGANIDAKTIKGNTALHLAAEKGNLEIVEALIVKGTDVNIENEERKKALDLAAELKVKNYIIEHSGNNVISSQIEQSQKKTFNKREGTAGVGGQFYEIKLSELFLLQGITKKADKKINSFYLASNMEEADNLDDVVFKYEGQGGKEKSRIIFLQAKHKEKETLKDPEKKVTIKKLLSDSDADFSLQKYFASYLKIKQQFSQEKTDEPIFGNRFEDLDCDFIIYTNALPGFSTNKGGIEELEKSIRKVDVGKDSILNLSEEAPESSSYYELVFGKDKDEEIVNALQYSSDCSKLARELARSAFSKDGININKPIFQSYHVPLKEKVLEMKKPKEAKFKDSFLDDDRSLSEEDSKFRSVFLEEAKKAAKKSEDELKLELRNKSIKISDKFWSTGNIEQSKKKLLLPNDSIGENDIKEFLSKLKLFVGQPNESELGEIIKQKIQSTYKATEQDAELILLDAEEKIRKWWKGEDYYLTENDNFFENARQNLAKLELIAPALEYRDKVEKLGIVFNEDPIELKSFLTSNDKQIFNLVSPHETILGSVKTYQILPKDGGYIFIRLSSLLGQHIQNRVMQAFNSEATSNLLVIECESTGKDIEELYNRLSKIVRSTGDKKVILITQTGDPLADKFRHDFSEDGKYEEKIDEKNGLTDLTIESQRKLLEGNLVAFQGREISLGALVDNKSKHLIDVEVLSKLISDERMEIGKAPYGLGEIKYYYIDRIFNRRIEIKSECFKEEDIKDLFVMSNIEETELSSLTYGEKVRKFRNDDRNAQSPTRFIILNDDENVQKNLKQLYKDYQQYNIHWLKKEDGKFIWQESQGVLSNLRKFVDISNINEYQADEITDIKGRVVIVSAEPGMGKSTVLTKLAEKVKKSDPSLWVVRINLNDHTENLNKISFSRNQDQAIDFLSNIVNLKTPLEQELLKRRINDQGKIALLFDGFDEISPTYKEKVIELLKILKDTKVERLWVTTRPHMKDELEDKLSVLSHTLKPLSRDDQKKFLKRFWSKKLDLSLNTDDNHLNIYVEKLLNVFSNSIADKEVEFTGIPLQTRMLAEAFQDNFKEFYDSDQDEPDLPEKLDLVDLYQRFIDKKYNIYSEEKKKQNPTNVAVEEDNAELRKSFIRNHQKAALYRLFEKSELGDLFSNSRSQEVSEFITRVKDGREKTGIIYQVINDSLSFIHRTFAEYFAACWLANNQEKQKVKDFLLSTMFKGENEVLRNFFDRILTKDEHGENRYEIHNAVLNENKKKVQGLLSDSQNAIDSLDKGGRTALHLAAAYGYDEIAQDLLSRGADIAKSDKVLNWSPLKYADKGNYWDIAELLLQKGANGDDMFEAISSIKDVAGKKKKTLLHLAAQTGYTKFAEVLVEKGADINAQNKDGKTPLHLAAENGHLDIVKLLVNKGAEININSSIGPPYRRRPSGWTPLHYAVFNSHIDVIEFLLYKKVKIVKDSNGSTPLDIAGREDIIKLLGGKRENFMKAVIKNDDLENFKKLTKGTDFSKLSGWSILHNAASAGSLKIVDFLVHNGAKIDGDEDCTTPLAAAAAKGDLEVVKYLVNNGANINTPGTDGWTPFHAAARAARSHEDSKDLSESHYLEIIKYFVEGFGKEKGVNIDVADKKGTTPLQTAAHHNRFDIVRYLVKEGANINAVDKLGATIVFSAAFNNNCEIVKFLIREGAMIDSDRGILGELRITVLHIAAMYNALEIVKLLVEEKKVDVNTGEDISLTPLHFAALSDNQETIEYLIEHGANVNAVVKFSHIVKVLKEKKKALEDSSMYKLVDKVNNFFSKCLEIKAFSTVIGLTPNILLKLSGHKSKLLEEKSNKNMASTIRGFFVQKINSYFSEQFGMLKDFIEMRKVGNLESLPQKFMLYLPDSIYQKMYVDGEASPEECLSSTSHNRRKREAKGECLFTWEDVDEFNEEEDEKRDFGKINIDGEKFVNYIEDLPERKQSQLIQLADKVKVTGESQSLVNKLIDNQKVISHLNRVGKISGMTMHGMMAKNVLSDFLNGDYQGVAINVGFIAGGQGFAKVAEAASFKGLKLASEGKLLLGRSLRAASPFLARGTSAFVVYDLVNQVKAFKNGTEEALVGVVGDSIYLGVDAAEIGIEIAEAFEVLEGVSSVTGPIGAAVGAVVFVGTDVYMAVKRVDKIDEIIHLTGKERFIEGLRAFIGMQPEEHIQELMQEKQVSNELVRQGLEYLKQHGDIQSYVFPTGKSVVDSCRKVSYKTSICDSGGLGGRCLKTRTVTRYAEECTTKFEIDLDNTVQLDKKRTDIKWSRAKPDNPSGGELFCLPRGNHERVPSYGSYLCENAIGITDLSAKTGNHTLINLGEGTDHAKGFIDSPNIFVVNNGSKRYFGGNKDDIFILQGGSITGYFYGEGGVNTLDLTSFAPEEGSIDVKLHIGQVEDHYRKNFFGMSGINKFLGRKAKADQVSITCDSDTSDIKFVDGQSGSEGFVDHINIHDKDCAYEMQIVVRPNTVIYNRALKGDFHYIVPYALGSAKVDFIYTAEALNLNNTFAFEYEPAQIKNVDVRNINVLNKTSHIITFNFSPMSDKEFNITISGASNPSYRLCNNTEIKVGNKGNLYMLENTNKSVDEIIKDYLVVANRLNRMSFFIQSLLSNETVAIGSGNYEVIHNNPLQKSHLVGNGGENVYVIDSKRFEIPLPEVVIYDLDIESSVDTIDLRNLVQQTKGEFSNSFKLQVLKSANDLLLKAIVEKPIGDSSISEKHEYFTVRLKDGVNWYNKTHVIMDNVPMRISLDNNEWSLKPQPLMFEKDKEVIVVTSQDVEENTELITPKKAGNYTFVRDHGSDLIITNAFNTQDDLCTIVLSKFYKTPKMETLSIKFADKEIVLKDKQKEINTARYVDIVKREHKEQVYSDVFNRSPEVMLSDQPHRHQIRHRRSTSGSARPSSWINDLFGWVKSSIGGLLSSALSKETSSTSSPISQVDAKMDVNGTIMLLDVIVRKFTGKQYIPVVDQSIPLLEARGYALNITNRFEKVLNKTAIKSGISVTNLNFDPVVVQSAIIGKIINGKFSEIAKTLYSFAKEACPEFKQTDKFIDHLRSNLKEEKETVMLQQKVEKPYKDLSQEVSRKVQLSKKPDTFLNGTSVVQGISRAIN